MGRLSYSLILLCIFSFMVFNSRATRPIQDSPPKGVVMTLHAPIFKEKSWNSKILKYVRRGDVLYINGRHLRDMEKRWKFKQELDLYSDYERDYKEKVREVPKNLGEEDEFFMTAVEDGQTGYIPSRFVKLLYHDYREAKKPMMTLKDDPTDYRLEEPLPKNYPFYKPPAHRGQLTIGLSLQDKDTYPFPNNVDSVSYGSTPEISLAYLVNVSSSSKDLLYFGGMINVQTVSNRYILANGNLVEERKAKIGIGPYISHDMYKDYKWDLRIHGAALFYLINDMAIYQENGDGNKRDRLFNAPYIGGKLGLDYVRKDVIDELDLVIGLDLNLDSPHTLESKDDSAISGFWQDDDSDFIVRDWHFSFSLYLGIQSTI